jgi:hypothetical protein
VFSVNWDSQIIMITNKHSNWNLSDVSKRNIRWGVCSIYLLVIFNISVIKFLVDTTFNDLAIMNDLIK